MNTKRLIFALQTTNMTLADYFPNSTPADIQQAYQQTIGLDRQTLAAVFNRENAALRFAYAVRKTEPENGEVTQAEPGLWMVTFSND